MSETDIVYSNPIKVDDNNIQLDKTSKVIISIASIIVNKELYELKLNRIDKILEVAKDLL